MAQIGTFTTKDGKYTGTIRTMTINVKAQLVPNKEKASDGAPDFRLYAGGAELGAAWRQESKDGPRTSPSNLMIQVSPSPCAPPSSKTKKTAPASWSGTGPRQTESRVSRRHAYRSRQNVFG